MSIKQMKVSAVIAQAKTKQAATRAAIGAKPCLVYQVKRGLWLAVRLQKKEETRPAQSAL